MSRSIYALCSEAGRALKQTTETFTDLDIAAKASAEDWTPDNFKEALKHAGRWLSQEYARGSVARYGPVSYKGVLDYARSSGRILYSGDQTGPKEIRTPNGTFAKLHHHEDEISSVGRKAENDRDDMKSWAEQQPGRQESPAIAGSLRQKLRKAEDENRILRQRVAELESRQARQSNGTKTLKVLERMERDIQQLRNQLDGVAA